MKCNYFVITVFGSVYITIKGALKCLTRPNAQCII